MEGDLLITKVTAVSPEKSEKGEIVALAFAFEIQDAWIIYSLFPFDLPGDGLERGRCMIVIPSADASIQSVVRTSLALGGYQHTVGIQYVDVTNYVGHAAKLIPGKRGLLDNPVARTEGDSHCEISMGRTSITLSAVPIVRSSIPD